MLPRTVGQCSFATIVQVVSIPYMTVHTCLGHYGHKADYSGQSFLPSSLHEPYFVGQDAGLGM